MSENDNVITDDFVLLDDYKTHNILESNSCELNNINDDKFNLNESICGAEKFDVVHRKDWAFGSILDSLKDADVENLKNVVEYDSTLPLSIEFVELDHESNENIKNDIDELNSYPITMIEPSSDITDTSKYQMENINIETKKDEGYNIKNLIDNMLKEESTFSSEMKMTDVNLQQSIISEVDENESKNKTDIESNIIDINLDNNKFNDADVMLEASNVLIQVNENNLKVNGIASKDFEDTKKEILKIDENSLVFTEDIEVPDSDLNMVRDNEIKSEDLNSVLNKIELPIDGDEMDFRVNIISRNDSEDTWSTNFCVHTGLSQNKLTNIDLNKVRDSETNCDNSNPVLSYNELPIKVDEPDFRVNIIDKNNSEDICSANIYVHNDHTDKKVSPNIEEIGNPVRNYDVIETEIHNVNYAANLNTNEIKSSTINSHNDERKFMTDLVSDEADFNNEKYNGLLNIEIENKLNSEENNTKSASNINENLIEKNMKEKLSINLSEHNDGCPLLSMKTLDIDDSSYNSCNNEKGIIVPNSQVNLKIEDVDQSEMHINETVIVLSQIENSKVSEKINTIEDENINHVKSEMKILHTDKKLVESIIIRPIGIDNFSKFIGISAVIEMLFNCIEFRCSMIDYHNSDQIAYFNVESRPDVPSEDILFINNLCKLFVVMVENKKDKIKEVANLIKKYFMNQSIQLGVYSGFNYLLKTINLITKKVSVETNDSIEKDDISLFNYKSQNQGFVTDLVCGQIKLRTFCENCRNIYNEEYEQINSLLLKIPKGNTNLNLEDCIKNFFSEVKVETTNKHSCCDIPTIKTIRVFTHTPEYLFICIDRELENGERDHTYIETDNGVIVETKNGLVLYSLCSVIDQMVINQSFYNNVKCLSNVWWMAENRGFRQIQDFEVISEYSIGFMLKKQTDN